MVTDKLVCRCKHSVMYAGYMVTLPITFLTDALESGKETNYGFRFMFTGWVFFAFILAYAFKNDFENSLMVNVLF